MRPTMARCWAGQSEPTSRLRQPTLIIMASARDVLESLIGPHGLFLLHHWGETPDQDNPAGQIDATFRIRQDHLKPDNKANV